MSTSILRGSLLLSKYQAGWCLDKLALLVIGAGAYGMAVAQPLIWEDWNVFLDAHRVWDFKSVLGGRGAGRMVGNFLTYFLIGNPFGLVQLGELVGVACLAIFIWGLLRAETFWVRAILSSLFVFGFPYFVHGVAFRAIGNNHGVSTLIFIWFLSMIARVHDKAGWKNHVSVAISAALLATAYEPWLLFLCGFAFTVIVVKFAPVLFGRLHIYEMGDWRSLALVLTIGGCLLLRAFTIESNVSSPKLLTLSALFQLCVATARVCLNIFVDSLPIGALIGFGVIRSSERFTFSKLGLWPYLLFGSVFAAVSVNFFYGVVLHGTMDWRARYVIILELTAFYFSLPWGAMSAWVQKHTGIRPNRGIAFLAALLSLKLAYTIWFTFIVTPVDRWGWLQYRSRIVARDPSVLQDFTDFGQCDGKYCFSFSGPGFAHSYISQYWEGGTAARLYSWLPIEGFY